MSNINQLRWQCRRGCRELDVLLLNYLEQHYTTASVEEQQDYVRLLALDDTVLMQYLLRGSPADDAGLAAVLAKMDFAGSFS